MTLIQEKLTAALFAFILVSLGFKLIQIGSPTLAYVLFKIFEIGVGAVLMIIAAVLGLVILGYGK